MTLPPIVAPREALSIAQFRQQTADHPYLRELIEGEIIMGGSPKPLHNLIVMRLLALLQGLIPHGTLMIAPMDVILDEQNLVQPDLFWMAENSACQEAPDGYYGPPDLIVEVLSPSTAKRDQSAKYRLYERVGVREYWVVDGENQLISVYALHEGLYRRLDAYAAAEAFDSPALGRTVALPTDLFAPRTPTAPQRAPDTPPDAQSTQ